ncbi:hypothetical protein [Oligoflexus tunisiensis]|uniref:hypothetical protein n=1 Tax=Oligoflexus tunisiensis TaxID=708132 RepID=UPI00114C883C|nr:hypothetical protein [Oligoflexus tunisiensis]
MAHVTGTAISAMLIPTIAKLSVSINKDLCVLFCLSILFQQTSLLLSMSRTLFSPRNIIGILLLINALYCLAVFRFYYILFYLAAVSFFSMEMALSSKRPLFLPWVRIRYFLAIVTATFIVVVLWVPIRQKIDAYWGNATILNVFSAERPSLVSSSWLLLNTIYQNTIGFIGEIAGSPNIAFDKKVAGIFEHTIFLSAFAIYAVKSPESTAKKLFIFFSIFHLSIQLWASPNLGGLFRLRIFEMLWVLTFSVSYFLQRSDRKIQNNEILRTAKESMD